jgi:hypothetical protein
MNNKKKINDYKIQFPVYKIEFDLNLSFQDII